MEKQGRYTRLTRAYYYGLALLIKCHYAHPMKRREGAQPVGVDLNSLRTFRWGAPLDSHLLLPPSLITTFMRRYICTKARAMTHDGKSLHTLSAVSMILSLLTAVLLFCCRIFECCFDIDGNTTASKAFRYGPLGPWSMIYHSGLFAISAAMNS